MLVDLQVLSSQTEHRYLLLLITSIIFRKVLKHCKFTVSQSLHSLHRNPPRSWTTPKRRRNPDRFPRLAQFHHFIIGDINVTQRNVQHQRRFPSSAGPSGAYGV